MSSLNAEWFLDIYRSICKDVEMILSLPKDSLEIDFISILRSVHSRGVEEIFLLSLPEICSDLEYSLEIGWYKRRFMGPLSKGNLIPNLFKVLYSRVFSEGGVLLEDPCIETIRCLRQLLRVFKKFYVDSPVEAKERTHNEFLKIEDELSTPCLSWGGTHLLPERGFPCLTDLVYRNLQQPHIRERLCSLDPLWEEQRILQCATFAQCLADRIVGKFSFRGSSKPKHGPGAVSEAFGVSKFEFPTWSWRLEECFPYDIYGIINHTWLGDPEPSDFRSERSAKVIEVPKDYKGPRLIASEPISAQYIQQLLLSDIRKNVKNSVLRHSIDFTSQEPSRTIALEASRDRSFSTIDLSSASDRLTCSLVECIFRRSFSYMEKMNSARTSTITDGDRVLSNVKKFAAQGAAFTFPVQSISYTILAAGCLAFQKPNIRHGDLFRKVRVFGDDIAVPSELYNDVVLLLTACELVVSQHKSFHNGFFRESCGMDAYGGHSVTPTYIRRNFERRNAYSTLSVVDTSNNLFLDGYILASATLLESIPQGLRKKIPWVSSRSQQWGIVSSMPASGKTRYNPHTQQVEAYCLSVVPIDKEIDAADSHRLMNWFLLEPAQEFEVRLFKTIERRSKYQERWVPVYLLAGNLS